MKGKATQVLLLMESRRTYSRLHFFLQFVFRHSSDDGRTDNANEVNEIDIKLSLPPLSNVVVVTIGYLPLRIIPCSVHSSTFFSPKVGHILRFPVKKLCLYLLMYNVCQI